MRKLAFWKLSILDLICCPVLYQGAGCQIERLMTNTFSSTLTDVWKSRDSAWTRVITTVGVEASGTMCSCLFVLGFKISLTKVLRRHKHEINYSAATFERFCRRHMTKDPAQSHYNRACFYDFWNVAAGDRTHNLPYLLLNHIGRSQVRYRFKTTWTV